MKINILILSLSFSLFIFAGTACEDFKSDISKKDKPLKIIFPKQDTRFFLGEPVKISLEITNNKASQISLDLNAGVIIRAHNLSNNTSLVIKKNATSGILNVATIWPNKKYSKDIFVKLSQCGKWEMSVSIEFECNKKRETVALPIKHCISIINPIDKDVVLKENEMHDILQKLYRDGLFIGHYLTSKELNSITKTSNKNEMLAKLLASFIWKPIDGDKDMASFARMIADMATSDFIKKIKAYEKKIVHVLDGVDTNASATQEVLFLYSLILYFCEDKNIMFYKDNKYSRVFMRIYFGMPGKISPTVWWKTIAPYIENSSLPIGTAEILEAVITKNKLNDWRRMPHDKKQICIGIILGDNSDKWDDMTDRDKQKILLGYLKIQGD